jgi:hypothetical protein
MLLKLFTAFVLSTIKVSYAVDTDVNAKAAIESHSDAGGSLGGTDLKSVLVDNLKLFLCRHHDNLMYSNVLALPPQAKVAVNNEVMAAVSNSALITPDGSFGMLRMWIDGCKRAGVKNFMVIAIDDQVGSLLKDCIPR